MDEARELDDSELDEIAGGLTIVINPPHINFLGTLENNATIVNNGKIVGSFGE